MKKITRAFIEQAAGVLGDTTMGLTGSEIVSRTAAFAVDFDIDIPHASYPFEAPNKRTALAENLASFTPEQQRSILIDLCEHLASDRRRSQNAFLHELRKELGADSRAPDNPISPSGLRPMTTEYYHVLIELNIEIEPVLDSDLTRSDLESRIIGGYTAGRTFLANGRLIEPKNIKRISVYKSDIPYSRLSNDMAERMGNTGILWAPSVEGILKQGVDLTNQFIAGPPGQSLPTQRRLADRTEPTMKIFISHSNKDAATAAMLIDYLRSALLLPAREIRCTSVDGFTLEAGDDFNSTIRREVFESTSFIALLSPASLASNYVTFELGARWGTEKPIAPIMIAGASPGDLKPPLSMLHALRGENESDAHRLITTLARQLSLNAEDPAAYGAALKKWIEAAPRPSDP